MISTGALKKGTTIELEGKLMSILDYSHIKTGRGSAQVKIKFRDVRSGSITEQTFQAGTKWPRARVETREMQYLYADDQFYYFMNTENFEQTHLTKEHLGGGVEFLIPQLKVHVEYYEGKPISVELPASVDMKVVEVEPGLKTATVSNVGKPATMETGLIVQVPQFVNEGDVIRVSTSEGTYQERVSNA